MPRRTINLPNRHPNLPFSDAVLSGNTLYLSGRIGLDPATNKVPADLRREIAFLLEGFRDVLAQAAMTLDDLVFVQVFCPDVSLWPVFNEEYVRYFPRELPARAFLGSGPLLFGAHFEMQGIAVRS
jgi:2-iminobutanoate/2-iminopropanoate deaminase